MIDVGEHQIVVRSLFSVDVFRPSFVVSLNAEDRLLLSSSIPVDTGKVLVRPLEFRVLSLATGKIESSPSFDFVQPRDLRGRISTLKICEVKTRRTSLFRSFSATSVAMNFSLKSAPAL